jgi:type III restriction enzyme
MAKKKAATAQFDFPFYQYLHLFYTENRGTIQRSYKLLTKKFLEHNNPATGGWLRQPQYEALEMYVFLKEGLDNRMLHEVFKDWYEKSGAFAGRSESKVGQRSMLELFEDMDTKQYKQVFDTFQQFQLNYPNYIFALTMGLGKTVLMATSIFYEFLLANKFPQDPKYCHNALVFAPDKTVLQSLKEIQTFDKSKVVPTEYVSWLDTHLRFHFLDESGTSLNVQDRSRYNLIISNNQKIILKRQHKEKTKGELLFAADVEKYRSKSTKDDYADLYGDIQDEGDLIGNQRFQKLLRLEQLGVYVDEAHHAFGATLEKDLMRKGKTSLRLTIDELAASLKETGTRVVGCYNYTGTPFVESKVLPEVVYAYGLKPAIDGAYLKQVDIKDYENTKAREFIHAVVKDFWAEQKGKRYEGMLPKLAFFSSTIEECTTELRPALEHVLASMGIPISSILVNVGDEKVTTNDDIREFNNLDTPGSEKQFILLVNKGKEGWNCRSLFSVALHRKPKSTVFVLQATMRCLRAITTIQQRATVHLSVENKAILDDELKQNFRLSIKDITDRPDEDQPVQVRVRTPKITVKLKRIRKLYVKKDKVPPTGLDFGTATLDESKYRIVVGVQRSISSTNRIAADVTEEYKRREKYTALTLVAELSRYMNKSPLVVQEVLERSKEGLPALVELTNKYNEVVYDLLVPKLFEAFYELQVYEKQEEEEVDLVKDPGDDGCYWVKGKKHLIVPKDSAEYKKFANRSFHLDNYVFDSKPEKEMFDTLLADPLVDRVYFTGMLTHGQSDFAVPYIDPVSHTLRTYYPDFLVLKGDGSYIIIEVKRDDQIDDEVVLAKQEYATQMAVASGMTYKMVKGTEAGKGLN